MKYCASSRQAKSFLRKVDEIRVQYKDINSMYDLIEELPDKTYIIDIPHDPNMIIDWEEIQGFSGKVDIIIALHNLHMKTFCDAYNLSFYWSYPITSWYELQGIAVLNPRYLFLGAPLCFDLENIKKQFPNLEIRLCPNVAYDAYIPREDGICGSWIRPEDTEKYEVYASAFEFAGADLTHEQTLFHVYAENKRWPGNLNLLIKNLDFDIDNRVIEDDVINARMTCGQRCMSGGKCRLCKKAFGFYSAARHWYYQNQAKTE